MALMGDMPDVSRNAMLVSSCHIEENSPFADENLIIGLIQGAQLEYIRTDQFFWGLHIDKIEQYHAPHIQEWNPHPQNGQHKVRHVEQT